MEGDATPHGHGATGTAARVDGTHTAAPPASSVRGPERPRALGRGPALVVLGVAVGITVLGGLAAVLSGSRRPAPHPAGRRVAGLAAVPARAALAPIERSTQPPAGVLSRIVVPSGWTRTGASCNSGGVDLYDCAVRLRVAAAPPSVLRFYESELHRLGWTKLSVTSTDHGLGTEVLEQVASADGYYWEVGVFVDPVTSSTAPAGGSTVEVRVVERDDGS